MAFAVAELQADPDFQALSPAAQKRLLDRAMSTETAGYQGAPDRPLEPGIGDVSDKTAGTLARVAGPAAGAMLGPPGFLASLLTSGAVGAGSAALGDAAEGKPMDPTSMAMGAAVNAGAAGAARPLGAMLGVLGAKSGLAPKVAGSLDLSKLQGLAGEATQAKGLLKPQVAGAGETIKEILDASGGTLPINAPGLQPSAEMIRKALPFKLPGGKEMYGALRGAATEQAPNYDKLLQQYRSTHAMFGKPTMKELMAMGLGGMAGYGGGGYPGILAALLPRLVNGARFAPPAPGIQAGMNAIPSLLDGLGQ